MLGRRCGRAVAPPGPEPADRRSAHRRPGFSLHDDHARAIELLERGRALAPGVEDVPFTLAVAYARAGRLEDARAATADALRLNPRREHRVSTPGVRALSRMVGTSPRPRRFSRGRPSQWPLVFAATSAIGLRGGDCTPCLWADLAGADRRGRSGVDAYGSDGRTALRTPTQIATGTAFIEEDLLCERSEA